MDMAVKPDLHGDFDVVELSLAARKVMEIFDQFIVYEPDSPEEARIMEFPAYMHLTEEDVLIEICRRGYTRDGVSARAGEVLSNSKDRRIIKEAVDDALITFRGKGFTIPVGGGSIPAQEFDILLAFAYGQATRFYRISETENREGFIKVCSNYAFRVNDPPGTRFRHWVSVNNMAKLFMPILVDGAIKDKIGAMIEYDEMHDLGHGRYFLRWREMGLL